MKIALVCSHGGHLTELLYLMDAFKGHEVFFVTYDNIRTRKLEYRKYLFPNLGSNPLILVPFRLLIYTPRFLKILRKEKPDLIISNGAEIAIPFFYLAKLLRIKSIFIECYTRIDAPTLSGRAIYPVSDLFLVLWPEMLEKYKKKAQYWGGIFDLEENEVMEHKEGEYILLITGMHSDFERLVKKMDEIADQINDKVIIQLGNTEYTPKNAEYFKFKDYKEIKNLISNAKIVICQGAITVMDAMILGTPVIAIPRLKEFGEHLDNHQLIFAEKLEFNGITVLKNLEDLKKVITTVSLKKFKIKINENLILKINSYINTLVLN